MPIQAQTLNSNPSQFWKQFFEASANVSLSSYEEPQVEEETVTETTASEETPSSSFYNSPRLPDDVPTDSNDANLYQPDDTSLSNVTPRAQQSHRPTAAAYSSPYEALRREVQGRPPQSTSPSNSTLPSTPRAQLSNATPESSPFLPPSTARPRSPPAKHRTPANDKLLHRVLDKTYRLQATPHNQPRLPIRSNSHIRNQTPKTTRRASPSDNSDSDSSPLLPAPQLHSEIFDSPARGRRPVPGVSVLTPAKAKTKPKPEPTADDEPNQASQANPSARIHTNRIFDSDSDSDSEADFLAGMSPPKTVQFHVPQSKLLRTPGTLRFNLFDSNPHPSPFNKTFSLLPPFSSASLTELTSLPHPAREASKRIVSDILLTAGGGDDATATADELDSPSVVGRGGKLGEEDTF